MLSPSLYCNLTSFLIKEAFPIALFLSYMDSSFFHISKALVSLATCCNTLKETYCRIDAIAFRFKVVQAFSSTPVGCSLYKIGSSKSLEHK
ncbi:unnamed protein product [Cuscuta campestris]|uniref:Uncharacterized protein n=2 Tax=Cuscuta campestris TaxID=132261 RepID=A0A484NA16_9ASTE|nr:unnamed protein product [Cuscuta campestris]